MNFWFAEMSEFSTEKAVVGNTLSGILIRNNVLLFPQRVFSQKKQLIPPLRFCLRVKLAQTTERGDQGEEGGSVDHYMK